MPLHLEKTADGLTRAVVETPLAEATIYLHGAHVTNWTPRGQQPVLYLSSRSLFEPGKAIRGGVPIVFPWFGPRSGGLPGPMHGYARISEWTLESSADRPDGSVEIRLSLAHEEYRLAFRVVVGATLEMELQVRNESDVPVRFEEALHTYFAVGDIRQVSISGLAGTTYIDKSDGFQRKQCDGPIRIAKETDQVHLNTASTCEIEDPVWQRTIVVEKAGSNATVVWNPWIEKNRTLTDMAPDDWQGMICVETANAGENAVSLAPGEIHTMRATIRSLPDGL